ncbi:MAG TPA: hypothetical protein DGT21_08720 [Armatimonadetes bacterium]|nr:hypothetical protein [Armatimonadota bacterium]
MKPASTPCVAVALLLLTAAGPGLCLTVFQAQFNGNVVTTEGQQPAEAEGLFYARGRCGTLGLVVGESTALAYPAPGNISLYQGTAMVWCRPVGWRGGVDDATRWVFLWQPEKTNKVNMIGLVQNRTSTVNVHLRDAVPTSLAAMTKPALVFQDGQWVHIAAAWSAFQGVLRLFVNGTLVDESRAASPLQVGETGALLRIGGSGATSLGGVIDEFVVSDKCLDETGVRDEMRKPISAYGG